MMKLNGEHASPGSASAKLAALEKKVVQYLQRMGLDTRRAEDGLYMFKYGSTAVMMSLFEEGDDTYVRCASTLLKEFEMSIELMTRLLRLNNEVLFGAFLLLGEDIISFAATILGDNLDFEELQKTLEYVARISDTYDDILQKMVGGKKASDFLKEAGGA